MYNNTISDRTKVFFQQRDNSMTNNTLSAPVGRSPREGNGDDVKNAPDDVDMLRRMLRANGLMVAETGAFEPGLLKAIEAAQKKAGIKVPDGVIDPIGKTADWLRPKFLRAEAERASEDARVRDLKLVEMTLQGEKLVILQKEHQKLVEATLDRLIRYCKSVCASHEAAQTHYRHYLDVATMERGLANAVMQAVIVKTFSVKWPDERASHAAIRATGALERAMTQRSLQGLMDTLPAAEQAISDFQFEMNRFSREFQGGAEMTGIVTGITATACFAVVGVLASAVLVAPAVGLTMAQASVASGAGVGVLSSMSKELGSHAAGMDVSVAGSVGRVVVDGIIGAVGGWVTEKVPVGFVDDMAKSAAMRFGAQFPGVAMPQVKLFFMNYFQGAGSETIKASITESVGIVGKMAKEQRMPTQKDFAAAVDGVLIAALSGGVMKNLGSFGKTFETDADLYVGRDMVPDMLKKLLGPGVLSDTQTRKLTVDAVNAVSGEVAKVGWGVVLEGAGDASVGTMTRLALDAVGRNAQIRKSLEVELERALKKAKIPLK